MRVNSNRLVSDKANHQIKSCLTWMNLRFLALSFWKITLKGKLSSGQKFMWTVVCCKLVNWIERTIKFCINHDHLSQSSLTFWLICMHTHYTMHQWTSMSDILTRFNTRLLPYFKPIPIPRSIIIVPTHLFNFSNNVKVAEDEENISTITLLVSLPPWTTQWKCNCPELSIIF